MEFSRGQIPADRIELRGEVHGHVAVRTARRLLFLEDLPHPQLVLGAAVAVEQRDHDPLDAGVEQLCRGLVHVLLAKRQRLLPEAVDPPADTLHQLARDERLVVVVGRDVETIRVGIAEEGLDPALQLEVVLLTGGDDDADAPALALEQPVQHRGARVDPGGDGAERLLGRGSPLPESVARRVHEADRLVLGRRLGLADHERPHLVDDEGVGHRPAGVDRQHPRRTLSHRRVSLFGAVALGLWP